VPQGSVGLFSVSISDNGIFRDKSRLRSIRGSVDFSSKVVGQKHSFGGHGKKGVRRHFSG